MLVKGENKQDIQTLTDCREYIMRNSKYTSTWLVIMRTLSDIIISFSLYHHRITTFVHTAHKWTMYYAVMFLSLHLPQSITITATLHTSINLSK